MHYIDLPAHQTFLISQKILIVEAEKLLVLKSRKSEFVSKSQWELPGGIVEMDEDLEEALKREANEEAGIEIIVHQPIAVWSHWQKNFKFKDGRVLDVRCIQIAYIGKAKGDKIKLSEEHKEYKWATKEELKTMDFSPNTAPAIQAYISNATINRDIN